MVIVSPPIELASKTVFNKLKERHCNKIYLATEDKNFVDIFKDVFKDLCITFDRKYVNYIENTFVGTIAIERENDTFLQGKDYLFQIVLLSTCDSFVLARCGAASPALMLAEKINNLFVFNLGNYGVYK